ncbi:hypothetical protein [Sphingobium yanoikuyae]|uniref:Transmembrane protein n=1 Tax=Sphingobium yanoikuyae TaxID=13690 RepID=A0A291N0W9_SPHYA|nr:hypothetical protein [Sphingobium yanoikuyae]ATI80845.1 hypothetical protein A6768_13220 [Sphingobium yanoikuyae]
MIRIFLFNFFYMGTCGFALWRGGLPERLGAILLVADFQLSHWLIRPVALRYSGVEEAMFAVDLAAFMGFFAISLFSTRYWPLWMATVQGCVAAGHMSGLRPDVIPFAYGNYVALWSYLLLVMLFVATVRHRRRRLRYGADPSWRWQLSQIYRDGGSVHATQGPAHDDYVPGEAEACPDRSRVAASGT